MLLVHEMGSLNYQPMHVLCETIQITVGNKNALLKDFDWGKKGTYYVDLYIFVVNFTMNRSERVTSCKNTTLWRAQAVSCVYQCTNNLELI